MHHQGRLGITGNADEPTGLVFSDQPGKWRVEPERSGPLTAEMLAAYRKGSSERFLHGLIRSAQATDGADEGSK